MERRTKPNNFKIIVIIIILAGAAVGGYFGIKYIYNKGILTGKNQLASKITDHLNSLGNAISSKVDFVKSITEAFSSIPSEVNTESIDDYITKLQLIIDSTTNTDVKNILSDYQSKWQDFKNIYAAADNAAITDAFNNLKTAGEDANAKIQSIFDNDINQKLEQLK